MLGGFFKGVLAGTVSFVVGFAVLSVLVPVEEQRPIMPQPDGQSDMAAPVAADEATVEAEPAETPVVPPSPPAENAVIETGVEAPQADAAPVVESPLDEPVVAEATPELPAEPLVEVEDAAPAEPVVEAAETQTLADPLPETVEPNETVAADVAEVSEIPEPADVAEPPVALIETPAEEEPLAETAQDSDPVEAPSDPAPTAPLDAPATGVIEGAPEGDAPPGPSTNALGVETAEQITAVDPSALEDAGNAGTAPTEEGNALAALPAAPEMSDEVPALATRPSVTPMPQGDPQIGVRRGGDVSTPGFDRVVEGVTTGRLPRIGDETAPESATPEGEVTQDMALPAYVRNAANVAFEPGVTRLGVVLVDAEGGMELLQNLPFSVTVAIDPFADNGPARARAYREAGHDIVLLARSVPALATPADLTVLLDAWFAAFPEVVGIMDVASAGVAANPQVARELAGMLVEDGYGVIAQNSGFDGFLQAARRADLAATGLYRIIDDADQSTITMRRLIERAAFEAGRQSGIVIAGSAGNARTIDALAAFDARRDQVGTHLVPASAMLIAE